MGGPASPLGLAGLLLQDVPQRINHVWGFLLFRRFVTFGGVGPTKITHHS